MNKYRPTTENGEIVINKAEKFKKYMLTIANRTTQQPDSRLSQELFDKYLPFAVLFGIEKEWSDVWEPILNSTDEMSGKTSTRIHYYPMGNHYYFHSWYRVENSTISRQNSQISFNLSGETFSSRLSRMISNTERTFSSVKQSSSRSGGGSGSSRSSGGGSSGFR